MSLILRKNCQVLLNEKGLGKLHVDVINKVMALVGECGQPLVVINGIKFSTHTPSVAELEYAVELFEEFLEKYCASILEVIEAKVAFKELEEPVNPYPNPRCHKNFCFEVTAEFLYCPNDKIKEYVGGSIMDITVERLKIFLANTQFISEAKEYQRGLKAYQEESKRVQALTNKLGRCTI